MKMSALACTVACLCACSFDKSPLHGKTDAHAIADAGGASAGDVKDSRTRDAGSVAAHDAATNAGSDAASVTPRDAGTAPDAGSTPGQPVTVPARTDAGVGDSGQFGSDPTPNDPMQTPQTGGLSCGKAACPFTTPPIEPCCTSQQDVDAGAAVAAERCGARFSATGSDFFDDYCWQRDQPGVVDDACPGVQVDLHSVDPGCCSDHGQCGGIDSEHGLGCHGDPGTTPQPCGATQGGADAGGLSCDPVGAYAMRLSVDLAWGGRSGGLAALTDDGRGLLVVKVLATIDGSDPATGDLHGELRVCNVELPAFYSTTLCEAYQPIFPADMWKSHAMPTFTTQGHAQCLAPGCIASIDAQTVLLGIQLPNPEAPWPTANQTPSLTCPAGSGAQCFPDHDGDGLPGLTVAVATQGRSSGGNGCNGSYANKGAPLSASPAAIFDGVRRTDRILLGVRMKLGASFKFGDGCETGNGSAIAQFVNSRSWGCLVERGTYNFPFGKPAGANDPCSSAEAAFMDANLPVYTILGVGETPDSTLRLADRSPSSGPQVNVVRLPGKSSAAGCDDVLGVSF